VRSVATALTVTVAVAATLAAPGPAAAQHPPLTLERALELAARNNPQYRQALNQMGLEGPAARQAWGAFLPSLDLSGGTSTSFTRTLVTEDFFGNPIENPNAETRHNSASSQGLSFSLPLFRGGRRFAELSRAKADARGLARAAEVQLHAVLADVERQYYQTQRQTDLLRVERDLLEGRNLDLEATRRLFGLASQTRVDVLGAELAVRQQERAVQRAGSERRKALLALRRLLATPDEPVTELAGAPVEIFDPSSLDADSLIARALASNPALAQKEAERDARRAGLGAARSRRWPTLSLNGSLTKAAFAADQNALFKFLPDDRTAGSLSLGISIPVFQQFQTSYQVAQARVDVRNADEGLRQERLKVEEEVRARLIDLEGAYRDLDLARGALDLAEERLRLAREQYRLAAMTFQDLQDVIEQTAAARRDVVNARYNFVGARIDLELALGARLGGGR